MALKGNIKDFQLEEILRFISAGKKTGALEINNGVETFVFYFRNGNLYFIYSSSRPYSITERILKEKIVSEEIAKDIKSGKKFPLDTVELTENAVKRIKEILLRDLSELGSSVLAWNEGNFIFKANEKRTGEDWGVGLEVEKFIEVARKQSEALIKLSRHVSSMDVKIYLNSEIGTEEDVILTGREWRFLTRFRPGMTVQEAAKASGLTLAKAVSIITSLMEKGLLKPLQETEEEKKDMKSKQESKDKERTADEIAPQEPLEEEIEEKGIVIETVNPEEQVAEKEENLLDELAAITGQYSLDVDSEENAKAELENILKTLRDL